MSLEPIPPEIAHAVDDSVAYRRALGTFATGVCVVTADGPAGPVGITINSFTSVSLRPRLVLWCLDDRSERAPAFAAADRFAIHVLDDRSEALARRFAKGAGALGPGEFDRIEGGPPLLASVAARFDCRAHERVPMGDHLIIVGEVVSYVSHRTATLTYAQGRYGRAGGAEE